MSAGRGVSLSAGEDGTQSTMRRLQLALVPRRRRSWGRASVRSGGGRCRLKRLQPDSLQASRIAWNKRGGAPIEQSSEPKGCRGAPPVEGGLRFVQEGANVAGQLPGTGVSEVLLKG